MGDLEKVIGGLSAERQEFLKNYFKNAPQWLLDSFQVVEFPANKTFVKEGDKADVIYMLLDGKVLAIDYRVFEIVYRHYEFYPIEALGAMEIIGNLEYYMTTLKTVEKSTFIKTSRKIFEKWLNEDINAYRIQAAKIERYLLKQARKERLNVLLSGNERVAIMLVRLYEANSANDTTTICISRKEFVETTGLSERTVTRVLKDFERKKLVSRRGWDVVMNHEQYMEIKKYIDVKVDASGKE